MEGKHYVLGIIDKETNEPSLVIETEEAFMAQAKVRRYLKTELTFW